MKLNEKQKSMIEVLQLAHDNLSKTGLCSTLFDLVSSEKITDRQRISARNFMKKYFSSDLAFEYGKSYWLSEYDYGFSIYEINETRPHSKQGFTQRKNLLLDAIEFIKATGVIE